MLKHGFLYILATFQIAVRTILPQRCMFNINVFIEHQRNFESSIQFCYFDRLVLS